MMSQRSKNFMRQFRTRTSRDLCPISADQLLQIWEHYDRDGNGYIEGDELDKFLKEFITSVCENDVGDEVISATMFRQVKADFLDAYDDNLDGRIDIRELAQMLPVDENFLLIFHLDNKLPSSLEFMKVWNKYDTDRSGFIEADELKNFLRDLLHYAEQSTSDSLTDEKLDEYTRSLLGIFDQNKDGKLQLSEMSRLLPVKENALQTTLNRNFFKSAKPLSARQIFEIFSAYDKNADGEIDGLEITAFVKDLLGQIQPSYTCADVDKFEVLLMKSCDLDGNGKLSFSELTLLLLGIQNFYKKPSSIQPDFDD